MPRPIRRTLTVHPVAINSSTRAMRSGSKAGTVAVRGGVLPCPPDGRLSSSHGAPGRGRRGVHLGLSTPGVRERNLSPKTASLA
jgi:hypothetical protein